MGMTCSTNARTDVHKILMRRPFVKTVEKEEGG